MAWNLLSMTDIKLKDSKKTIATKKCRKLIVKFNLSDFYEHIFLLKYTF